VLFFGFGTLVVLILLAGLGAARRGTQIHREMTAIYETRRDVTAILHEVASGLNLSGIYVRDYLLDPSHLTAAAHRRALLEIRSSMTAQLDRLAEIVGQEETGMLGNLRRELDGYWESLDPLFDWSPQQKMALSAFFLRQQVLPRREAVLAIAREIREFNEANFRIQRRRLEESQAAFRYYLAWTVGIAAGLGLMVAAISVYRISRLEREATAAQTRTQAAEGEMRRLSRELVRAQESERKSLSRELHDEVGQSLTALRMELANLERLRSTPGGEFAHRLQDAKRLAEDTLAAVRKLAMGLRPAMLDDLGLGPALEWQGREFARHCGIPVDVQIDGDLDNLPEPHRTCVFRVVQEALTNCARHARARSVRVAVHGAKDFISVNVQDDGVGIDPATARRGMGLIGIEERARELGGTLVIDVRPGRGASLQVEIPLPRELEA